jgi:hypothetical protein
VTDIQKIANTLLNIVTHVSVEEFYWQDAHYSTDSRLGRELLYLLANDEWIRSTTEILDVSRADTVTESIRFDVDLDRITHEAFHEGTRRIWLPVFTMTSPEADGRDPAAAHAALSVTDASGTQLAPVPQADVRHQLAAALAEVIVNFAVARWPEADERRPEADRDQRLLLSAALFRLLGGETPAAHPSPHTLGAGRMAEAKTRLTTLLRDYADNYAADPPPRPFARVLTERAGLILDALTESVVVVVGVDRGQSGVVLNVAAPARRLRLDKTPFTPLRWAALLRPRAHVRIDLLLPSADADRQVEVHLPDGVAIDTDRTAAPTAGLWIESGPPPATEQLASLVGQLKQRRAHDHAIRRGLADMAIAKADVLAAALRGHRVLPEQLAGDGTDAVLNESPDALSEATELTRLRLSEVREALVDISEGTGEDREEADVARLEQTWQDGAWIQRPLLRVTRSGEPGERRLICHAGLTENSGQRATPAYARVNVPVHVPDASFGLIARFSGAVSALLMIIVFFFFLVSLIEHRNRPGGPAPSAEVLASALTLFSVIQAGRIEIPDRSTLRGLLSGAGTWLIIASLLPTVFLAILLAFNISGTAPVVDSAVAIVLQLAFVGALSRGPFAPRAGVNAPPARVLHTAGGQGYQRAGVLHEDWWRSTTASLLVTGREAHAYLTWEHAGLPSLERLLETSWRPEQLTALASRLRSVRGGREALAAATENQLLASWPPNLLALLRSGTARQALTFLVFRQPPPAEWPPTGRTVRIRIDPDRLAPVDQAVEPLDIWVGVPGPGDFALVGDHPLRTVLDCAAARGLLLQDIQFPAPPPGATGATGADDPLASSSSSVANGPSASRTYTQELGEKGGLGAAAHWARLRIGLHDTEIPQLGPFLRELRSRLARRGSASRLLARTTGQAPFRELPLGRTFVTDVPGASSSVANGSSATGERLVLATELDTVTTAVRGGFANGVARDWRVLAICADARTGIESSILRAIAELRPRLRLASLSHAVLHGTSVLLLLCHQPEGGGDPPLTAALPGEVPGSGLLVAIDEWQTAIQLGMCSPEPLMRVRARSQDRPGMLLDVLNALRPALASALPTAALPPDAGVWQAMLTVTAGRATTARLTLKLPVNPLDVREWGSQKYGEIEREARYLAAIRSAEREPGTSPEGERSGIAENTVITVSLIRAADSELP